MAGNSDALIVSRYNLLINLWVHHNGAQLQWPSVVLSAALIVVSFVVPNQVSKIGDIATWGSDTQLTIIAGVPLLLTGMCVAAMTYTMGRGRKILRRLTKAIHDLEKTYPYLGEIYTNTHVQEGISALVILRGLLTIFFALPLLFCGLVIILGITWGTIVFGLLNLCWFAVERIKEPLFVA